MGVEAWTLTLVNAYLSEQKVFNSLGDVPAPGAVRIRGQTKTVQVSCEYRVPQAGVLCWVIVIVELDHIFDLGKHGQFLS